MVKVIWSRSKSRGVGGLLREVSGFWSRHCFKACSPAVWEMLVYIDSMAAVTRRDPGGCLNCVSFLQNRMSLEHMKGSWRPGVGGRS